MVASERRAWAYVDPGTGLIALQTFASLLAAYAYIVRRKIRAFFMRRQPKSVPISIPAEASRQRKPA